MGLMDEGETVVVSQWIASKKCGNRHHADRKKETWVIELTWYSSEHMSAARCRLPGSKPVRIRRAEMIWWCGSSGVKRLGQFHRNRQAVCRAKNGMRLGGEKIDSS